MLFHCFSFNRALTWCDSCHQLLRFVVVVVFCCWMCCCFCFCNFCCGFCCFCYYSKFSRNWASNGWDLFVVAVVFCFCFVSVVVFVFVLSQKPSIKSLVKIGSVIDEILLLLFLLLLLLLFLSFLLLLLLIPETYL